MEFKNTHVEPSDRNQTAVGFLGSIGLCTIVAVAVLVWQAIEKGEMEWGVLAALAVVLVVGIPIGILLASSAQRTVKTVRINETQVALTFVSERIVDLPWSAITSIEVRRPFAKIGPPFLRLTTAEHQYDILYSMENKRLMVEKLGKHLNLPSNASSFVGPI